MACLAVISARFQVDRVNFFAGDVVELGGEGFGGGGDLEGAEELVAVAGGAVGFEALWNGEEFELGAEGGVELAGAEGAGVGGAGDEFPEGSEVGEFGGGGVVVVGGGVVDVGGDEEDVLDGFVFDEFEEVGDFELAAEGRAVVGVGDGFVAVLVGHDEAEGHVAGDDFPGGCGGGEALLEPSELRFAQDGRFVVELGLFVLGVGSAVAAHVPGKDFDVRTEALRAINALAVVSKLADGLVFEKGGAGAGGEESGALLVVTLVFVAALGKPVVVGFVVVPEDELTDAGVEAADIFVEQVVAVGTAEIVERLGDVGLGFGGDVFPERAVVEFLLRRNGIVGVDRVAEVDEEVGLGGAHGFEHLQAAASEVDAIALAADVAGEGDFEVAGGPVGTRRSDEGADDGFAPVFQVAEILKEDTVEDAFAGGEVAEVELAGEVGGFDYGGTEDAGDIREAVGFGPFDDHLGRTVGGAPDDRAVVGDVSAGGAARGGWARTAAVDDGGRGLGAEEGGEARVY